MSRFARLRNHPAFADYFDAVHPLFWVVLVWQLLRAADIIDARGGGDALLSVYWWGRVEIDYISDPAPAPSAYGSLSPTRKAWSDPCWSSAVPADLLLEARAVIFPRTRGGFEGKAFALQTPREGKKGACALTPHADTS